MKNNKTTELAANTNLAGLKWVREQAAKAKENKLFPKDDLLWNAAVTAGNKMVTAGTTWTRFEDVGSLTPDEKKALLGYLDLKG